MIDSFWQQLLKSSTCELEVFIEGKSEKAKAAVSIDHNEEQILYFEKGKWEKSQITFTNSYRWIKKTSTILLEHLRFGISRPILLAEFHLSQENLLISFKPHICEQDSYNASCLLQEKKLLLTWQITGPEKKQKILCSYS